MKNKIHIAPSSIMEAGRGVFASVDIKKGEIIEICPILIFLNGDSGYILETLLQKYVYDYTGGATMMALGYGSLYNHKSKANAKYELVEHNGKTEGDSELYITAIKPISKNEEIYIDYGSEPCPN